MAIAQALFDYVNAAHGSRQHPISLVYVHITNKLEEFPHGFLKGVANRLLDFGQHVHSMNADLLLLSTADSVHALSLNMQVRERNFLARRMPGQRLFVAAERKDFAKDFPSSEFGKQWATNFTPTSTNIQFSENTQYSNQPSAVAVFSPVGIGAYRRSREIRQEEINTLRK